MISEDKEKLERDSSLQYTIVSNAWRISACDSTGGTASQTLCRQNKGYKLRWTCRRIHEFSFLAMQNESMQGSIIYTMSHTVFRIALSLNNNARISWKPSEGRPRQRRTIITEQGIMLDISNNHMEFERLPMTIEMQEDRVARVSSRPIRDWGRPVSRCCAEGSYIFYAMNISSSTLPTKECSCIDISSKTLEL